MRIRSSRQTSQASVPLRLGTTRGSSQDPQISLDVSRVRWRDLFALRNVRQRYSLSVPARNAITGQPGPASMRQLMPLTPSDDRVIVARIEGRTVGYAVFRRNDPDRRWTLEGIGANLGVYEMEPLWEELVRFGVVAAGLEGTRRLYARVRTGGDIAHILHANGFSAYTREHVLSAPMLSLAQGSARVRNQQPSDVWAIHQLYMAAVPQAVQAAEALTSHTWDIKPRLLQQSVDTGWIVDDGYQIAGYARCESWNNVHIVEFMVSPQHRQVFPRLIGGVLADLAAMPARQVCVLVRDYQQEYIPPLEEIGLRVQTEQSLYVKYTTAATRAQSGSVVSFPQEVKEPSAKRVPTFLKGSSGDPASKLP